VTEFDARPSPDRLQQASQSWWEANPMTYDWQKQLPYQEGTPEFFEAIDRVFFETMRYFAHPNWPDQTPFSELIDYQALKDKDVLVVGCGAGAVESWIARAGARVVPLDFARRAVSLTRLRFEQADLPRRIVRSDAQHLPFPAETFDFVWSWGVVHCVADTQAAIDEIYRVLRPGGSTSVMVYHKASMRYWIWGGLVEGILRGKLLRMSLDEVQDTFTDGAFARHYTAPEFGRMFAAFNQVRTRVMDQADMSYLPGYPFLRRAVLCHIVPARLRERFERALLARWGWFLYLEAAR
jgi:ubiquinone/menaquinone biosynthesis C-methylase UbiE